jgi:MFS family permease
VVGSLVAGFAGNIEVLIAGRVAQGIGGGGLTALAQVIMAAIVSPRELGKFSGILGGVFAVAGPLIGGVLVDAS